MMETRLIRKMLSQRTRTLRMDPDDILMKIEITITIYSDNINKTCFHIFPKTNPISNATSRSSAWSASNNSNLADQNINANDVWELCAKNAVQKRFNCTNWDFLLINIEDAKFVLNKSRELRNISGKIKLALGKWVWWVRNGSRKLKKMLLICLGKVKKQVSSRNKCFLECGIHIITQCVSLLASWPSKYPKKKCTWPYFLWLNQCWEYILKPISNR